MPRHQRERHESETARSVRERERYVAALVEQFKKAGLDYMITCSFSEETYEQYGLKDAQKMMDFTLRRLEAAGYYGPYAVAVHDKHGSSYWHPHLMIVDAGKWGSRVERELFKYGDLGRKSNGVIRSEGGFLYIARRAVEYWPDAIYWDYRPDWVRRPRPSGRGGRHVRTKEAPAPAA